MRPRLYNMLIPMALLAATAIPSDPARADSSPCPRSTAAVAAKAAEAPPAKAKVAAQKPRKEWQKLEAL